MSSGWLIYRLVTILTMSCPSKLVYRRVTRVDDFAGFAGGDAVRTDRSRRRAADETCQSSRHTPCAVALLASRRTAHGVCLLLFGDKNSYAARLRPSSAGRQLSCTTTRSVTLHREVAAYSDRTRNRSERRPFPSRTEGTSLSTSADHRGECLSNRVGHAPTLARVRPPHRLAV